MTVINLNNYRSKRQRVSYEEMDKTISAHIFACAIQVNLIAQYMLNRDMPEDAENLCRIAEILSTVGSRLKGSQTANDPTPAA